MPPKRITILPPNQGTMSLFFTKPAKKTNEPAHTLPAALSSKDKEIQDFYNSLSEKEKIAHAIAVEKLGTSYDVTRTHGFLAKRK